MFHKFPNLKKSKSLIKLKWPLKRLKEPPQILKRISSQCNFSFFLPIFPKNRPQQISTLRNIQADSTIKAKRTTFIACIFFLIASMVKSEDLLPATLLEIFAGTEYSFYWSSPFLVPTKKLLQTEVFLGRH